MILHGTLSTRIVDVLEVLYGVLPSFECVVVRGLDSERNPLELQKVLSAHQIRSRIAADQVVVSQANSRLLVNRQVLAGFDELWFSSASVWKCSIPDDLALTSDGSTFSDRFPSGLIDLMQRCACGLVMGDGCGLNFATSDREFAASLHATFNSS